MSLALGSGQEVDGQPCFRENGYQFRKEMPPPLTAECCPVKLLHTARSLLLSSTHSRPGQSSKSQGGVPGGEAQPLPVPLSDAFASRLLQGLLSLAFHFSLTTTL